MPANAAAPAAVAQHRVGLLAPPALALLILTISALALGQLLRQRGGSEPHPPRPRRRIFTARARSARAWPWSTATCLLSIFGGGWGLAQTLHSHDPGLTPPTPPTLLEGTLTWGTLTLSCGCTYSLGHHTPSPQRWSARANTLQCLLSSCVVAIRWIGF